MSGAPEIYRWTDKNGTVWVIQNDAHCFYRPRFELNGRLRYASDGDAGFAVVLELLRLAPLAPLLDPEWKPSEEGLAALPEKALEHVHDLLYRAEGLEVKLAEAQAENERIHAAAATLLSRLAEHGVIELGEDYANALAAAVLGEDHETTKELRKWGAV